MNIVSISDVHLSKHNLVAESSLKNFFHTKEFYHAEIVIFLGDIFDLLIGSHVQYISNHKWFFHELVETLKKGKKIFFLEGNHDFHFKDLFYDYFSSEGLNKELVNNFQYKTAPFLLRTEVGNLFFCHGDEIEFNQNSYQRYRSIIRSRFINLLANNFASYEFINSIGVNASKKSRENNMKYSQDDSSVEEIKNKFRNIAKKIFELDDVDGIICGHSHVKDKFVQNKKIFINNGYFPLSKSFVVINNLGINHLDLPSE